PTLSKDTDPWRLHEKTLHGCSLEDLVSFLTSHRTPLSHLQQEAGAHRSRFIQKMSSNDVGSGNVIKQIFQEIYLGPNLFTATYHLPASYATGEGLITRETLLIDADVFETLAAENLLALATGRPEAEATYALDHFKIRPYFSSVFSLDDCLRAEKSALAKTHKTVSLSKPHPFMLDAIAKIHAADTLQRYYIGDMPDDMLAANRSEYEYTGIGIVSASPNKANLQQALQNSGARHIIQDISELYKILVDKP
ncbi:MAG: HAD family hydrolase, partial [Deltaproteobacteria bacterium]|nr:HAD family hydrolase [Deltaproteobacteria bacterium]